MPGRTVDIEQELTWEQQEELEATGMLVIPERDSRQYIPSVRKEVRVVDMVPVARSILVGPNGLGCPEWYCKALVEHDFLVLAIAAMGESEDLHSTVKIEENAVVLLEANLTWLSRMWPEPWCFWNMSNRNGAELTGGLRTESAGVPFYLSRSTAKNFSTIWVHSSPNTLVMLFGLEKRPVLR